MDNERRIASEALDIAIDKGAAAEASRDRWKLGALSAGGVAAALAIILSVVIAIQ